MASRVKAKGTPVRRRSGRAKGSKVTKACEPAISVVRQVRRNSTTLRVTLDQATTGPSAALAGLPQGQSTHRGAHRGQPALEVHDTEHGLQGRGENRLAGASARLLLPPAEPQEAPEVQLRCPAREVRPGHHLRAAPGQLADGGV